LPSQTLETWHASLAAIEQMQVPHVSVYMLEVDQDSRLGKELILGGSRYGAGQVPGEAEIVAFYEEAVDRLAHLGMNRYEISNFAKPGFESLHNLKYWRLEPYFGFGADAHSFDGVTRWQNVETAASYVARWTSGASPRDTESLAIAWEERFFVGLRLMEGIALTDEDWRRYSEPINRFLDCGLLESREGRLRLTRRGVLLSNEVFEEFIAPCV
jgi:oxygen-independent coproporphyrinogen-3 oxidase